MIRQTFNRHRKAIQDMLGISIECRTKGGYRYYIEDKESLKDNSFKNWMLDSLSINNILMDSGSSKERLLMEHIPAGKDYFQYPCLLPLCRLSAHLAVALLTKGTGKHTGVCRLRALSSPHLRLQAGTAGSRQGSGSTETRFSAGGYEADGDGDVGAV